MIVDFHSHVLPGLDDGSSNIQESISMLRMEAKQQIGHVIATPHFYPQHDTPERFLARRDAAEAKLREEMEKHPGLPRVSIGAEVYFFHGISNSDAIYQLTIDKKQCILLEMPIGPWTDRMYQEVEDIYIKHGITPIIAHVDRYIGPFRTHGIPRRLEELPVLVQANASFFCSGATRPMALHMLKKDQIHLIGSDCHNMSSRKPNLGDAVRIIRQRLGQETLDRIESYQDQVLRTGSSR